MTPDPHADVELLQPGEVVYLPPPSLDGYEVGRVYAGRFGRLWRCVEMVNGVPELRSITEWQPGGRIATCHGTPTLANTGSVSSRLRLSTSPGSSR